MSLVNDLAPFEKEIKAFELRGALPQGEVKKELAKIYEKHWQPHWGPREVNLGCGTCIFDMMTVLVNNLNSQLVFYKAIKVKTTELSEVVPDELPTKMHKVRSLAKSLDIEYTSKTTKQELIEKINEKRARKN